ncbi:Uncharacterized conserved protein [Noviherbaspirillum humi]|uniref:Uncharacterized conserved protein n=1 Tax=Noviherbaspirillum humi TaxID=1688639 RepID=A0A239FGZ9_9BURK|nr:hypothetical protein [Noviherbaspirillum humi]SNS56031.1 Uncharacterized conserved protein [Noviherbaspirillum humi]
MRLVGHDDLQGRSAYQPIIHAQGNRWIAYVGHHGGKAPNPLTGKVEDNGTSIVDVSDPAKPRYLAHMPGEPGEGESGGAQMVRLCSGKTLPQGQPDKFYLLRTFGNSAHEIWDVSAPEKPALVSRITGVRDTHKNFWECDTGIAYLVSGAPGWKTRRMTQVYDLSDPAKPRFIRNFGLVGQQPGAPDSLRGTDYEMHGPIRVGNRIYFGYNTFLNGVIQIIDREKLLRGNPAAKDPYEPTDDNLTYPVVTTLYTSPRLGAHTTLPLLGMEVPEFAKNTEGRTRDILVVVNESLRNECQENRQMMYVVDITSETKPWGMANFQVPEKSGDFCARGGRFGTHSSNESMTSPYHKKLVFLAYFNAGIRAVDIRDPWSPKEVGYFIPAVTDKTDKRCIRVDGAERCKVAVQTNNVEVDDRGYIYGVDRANTGLHIVELTGAARSIAQP